MLAALGTWPDVVVVDEPPELDQALSELRGGVGSEADVGAVLASLGRRGPRVIVKTDAWHALEFVRLRAVAATVPYIFVHRDPAEILVSHRIEPGSHTVPGVLSPVWFGTPRTVYPLPHAAAVLRVIFEAATPHVDASTLLDYAELPDALTARVAPHFGLEPALGDTEELAAVLGRHAKRPYLPFEPDGLRKRAAVTPEIAALAMEVAPAYWALLRRREVVAA